MVQVALLPQTGDRRCMPDAACYLIGCPVAQTGQEKKCISQLEVSQKRIDLIINYVIGRDWVICRICEGVNGHNGCVNRFATRVNTLPGNPNKQPD